jgi:hypothetical protein
MKNASRLMVGKPEWNTPLGEIRCTRGNNIETDLIEMVFESVDWMYLAQDSDGWRALVNTVMNLTKDLEFLD